MGSEKFYKYIKPLVLVHLQASGFLEKRTV